MKKSLGFENLNLNVKDSSEQIILSEFIKNINDHIVFLKSNFPEFYEKIFIKKFASEIVKEDIHLARQKATILILRSLFEGRSVHQDRYDDSRVENFEKNKNIMGGLLLPPVFVNKKEHKYEVEELEYLCRKERQIRKIVYLLGPKKVDLLLRDQTEIKKVLGKYEYSKLASKEIGRRRVFDARKGYLKKTTEKNIHRFLFFEDFYAFVCNYIYAKGFICSKENFCYNWLGADRVISARNHRDFFRQAFLVFSLYERIILLSSELGNEIFGHMKNPIAPNGASLNAYENDFIDEKLAEKIRKEGFFNELIPMVNSIGRDDMIKARFLKFMSGEEDCLMIPVKTLRHMYVACGVNNNHIFDQSLVGSESSKNIFDNLLNRILLWIESRFTRCMKFF